MIDENYSPPVSNLLRYGDVRNLVVWHDYVARGIGPEHIPDLIRMALDETLHDAGNDSREVWAPVHAWRALGQLRAEEAAGPLTELLWRADDEDEWVSEELPKVFAMIGPSSLPVLSEYLQEPLNAIWPRVTVVTSIEDIAKAYPESRDEAIRVLSRGLENYAIQRPILNGYILAGLLKLKAVEALPLIEEAFSADMIDKSICGDLEDVQIELGVRTERATPARNYLLESLMSPDPLFDDEFDEEEDEDEGAIPGIEDIGLIPLPAEFKARRPANDAKKAKSKRKQAKKSRKKNRKK